MANKLTPLATHEERLSKVTVPLDVALDGIAFQIQDAPEAFHTLQAFIGLMKEESDDVQRVVVEALLVASGSVDG